MKKSGRAGNTAWIVFLTLLVFLVLFSFSSLNLKTIEYGYRLQGLRQEMKSLQEELDRLQARRALLLNLERIESVAVEKLGFRYPESEQIIKVYRGKQDD